VHRVASELSNERQGRRVKAVARNNRLTSPIANSRLLQQNRPEAEISLWQRTGADVKPMLGPSERAALSTLERGPPSQGGLSLLSRHVLRRRGLGELSYFSTSTAYLRRTLTALSR